LNFISSIQTSHIKLKNIENFCVSFVLFMRTWIFREKNNVTNASELIKASQDLIEIWLRFDSDMIQHLFSFLTSSNQLLLSFRQTHFFVLRVVNRCLWQTHFFVSQTSFESTFFLCINTFSLRLTLIWITII